jgi:predicted RNA-binding protein YlqC (UPF0109 family)
MRDTQQIADLMTDLIRLIVDKPDEARIEILPKLGGAIFRLSLAPDDVGKVIGKDGRNAASLRGILEAIARKTKQKISLKIGI